MREAFTDRQSYRSLYEDLLQENRELAEELMIAESRLGQHHHTSTRADIAEIDRLAVNLARTREQNFAYEQQLVQLRNEEHLQNKAHTHELEQARARETAQEHALSQLQLQLNEYKEAFARAQSDAIVGRGAMRDAERTVKNLELAELAHVQAEALQLKHRFAQLSTVAAQRAEEIHVLMHEKELLRRQVTTLTAQQQDDQVHVSTAVETFLHFAW
jgi:hypothetical protein